MNEELYQEEIGKLLAERNVLHAEACQVWTHVPDGYKLASVGNPVEAVRLMVEGLAVLAADGAALRERLAAVEKAFADAEQDRFADIQTALARERARVEAEFERLRAEVASGLCSENGKWLTATEKTTNSAIESALRAIDAARERLMGAPVTVATEKAKCTCPGPERDWDDCPSCFESAVEEQHGVDGKRLLEGETRKQWRARKVGGSYQYTGTVVAEFLTTSGQPRIVLEFDAPVQGMLFIYNRDQVEEIGEQPENERLMGETK